MLFFTSSHILCAYMDNSVRINIECNFNLRNSTRCRRNSCKVKITQSSVLGCHFALTLKDMDAYSSLIVHRCRENLALLCRNCCVTVDKASKDSAHCFDSQRKRCNIKQKNIFYIACKNTALNCSSNCNCFIRVNRTASFFSKN